MRLFYFSGGPRERVLHRLVEDGHEIAAVYVNNPEKYPKVAPTIDAARGYGLDVNIIRRADLPNVAEIVRDEVCLSVGFNTLLPPFVLDAAKVFLNVHGTLLPRYRGGTAPWMIERGDTENGITVHALDAGLDTGPIVTQRSYPIGPFDTWRSIQRRGLEIEPDVVCEALALYEQHGDECLKPQSEFVDPELPNRIVSEHAKLDPSRPLVELIDQIRSWDADAAPAYFIHHGERVCVKLWRPDKPSSEGDMI